MLKEENKIKLVYLGCGNDRLKDFIHVDIDYGKNKSGPHDIIADMTEYLPFKDNSVDLIYSKATIPALSYQEFINNLLESHRILKKGGCVRMVLFDFDILVKDYLNKVNRPEVPSPGMPNENYVDTFVRRMLYFTNRYLHNFDTLKRALKKTGFEQVKECNPGDTRIECAKDELLRVELNRDDNIIVEAVKLDEEPTAKYASIYPKNHFSLDYFLAKYLNVKISRYVERKPMFIQRYWLKTMINFNKNKKY